jgi:hypothetical protein
LINSFEHTAEQAISGFGIRGLITAITEVTSMKPNLDWLHQHKFPPLVLLT